MKIYGRGKSLHVQFLIVDLHCCMRWVQICSIFCGHFSHFDYGDRISQAVTFILMHPFIRRCNESFRCTRSNCFGVHLIWVSSTDLLPSFHFSALSTVTVRRFLLALVMRPSFLFYSTLLKYSLSVQYCLITTLNRFSFLGGISIFEGAIPWKKHDLNGREIGFDFWAVAQWDDGECAVVFG